MKIYVFGNQDLREDSSAIKVYEKLKDKVRGIEFIQVDPNQDLPFKDSEQVVILDTVLGIDKVSEIQDEDLDKIILAKSLTVHDFDLGFQLRYLKKIGKLGKVMIIGIPKKVKKEDYSLIQSILRKLVAQDIHGS
jgi:Ni,Fe-hydrogenase maturation factor